MCGRFVNTITLEDAAERYRAVPTPGLDFAGSDNASPGMPLPVLLGGDRGRRLGCMTWGWRRDWLRSRLLINAKSEEAPSKPTFREAFAHRRAAVPAEAFYEWGGSPKRCHVATHRDGPFLLAALWERDGEAGRFTVLTCAANHTLEPVHQRMPCLVAEADLDPWLAGAAIDLAPTPATAWHLRAIPGPGPAWREAA